MTTLNRFPLLGLWAREAALRVGHAPADADALGHAYAVLYAIRASVPPRAKDAKTPQAAPPAEGGRPVERLLFAGDEIDIRRVGERIIGQVGGDAQTPGSFRHKIRGKYPAGWFDRLEAAFRAVLARHEPERLGSRLVYSLYDQWKKACAAGRLVDLDRLLAWCEGRAAVKA
ncbi:MAG: hypothetical protein K2W96_28190 [Gemmataceae bacterium]|nr:hypothetical protein [Gemmataceae bacterium]